MKKAIICAFGLAVLATPAFADDYWVVRDSSTKHCTVVTTKPTTTTGVQDTHRSRKLDEDHQGLQFRLILGSANPWAAFGRPFPFTRMISVACGPRQTQADLAHEHFTQSIRSA
jgi:hypothetical protein